MGGLFRQAPAFWEDSETLPARLLSPFTVALQGAHIWRRMTTTSYQPACPVICVGNPIMGGAGKTPAVMAIAKLCQQAGHTPHILTRGYGGTFKGPVRVNPSAHQSTHVGDEALLHTRIAPTWVSRNRVEGAKRATSEGASVLIMDDGMQNLQLVKTATFCVLDGPYGIGNGKLFPAGPLREPFDRAMQHSQAVILIGEDRKKLYKHIPKDVPVLHATIEAKKETAELFHGQSVFAFCGIGRPAKFYSTLAALGITTAVQRNFPDHHPYSEEELTQQLNEATNAQLPLLTTEKDWVRLPPEWQERIPYLPIELKFDSPEAVLEVLRNHGIL